MRRILLSIGVVVLLLASQLEAKRPNSRQYWGTGKNSKDLDIDDLDFSGTDIGITTTHEDEEGDDDSDYESSGSDRSPVDDPWGIDIDDEDLSEESGSGVPEPETSPQTPTVVDAKTTTTAKTLTGCQQLYETGKEYAMFVPNCTRKGDYWPRQCLRDFRECWCVDPKGKEINGSRFSHPIISDCYKGKNLKPCVFAMVRYTHGLLGAFEPNCTMDGDFRPRQCHGSECWCVDKNGNEILGTVVPRGAKTHCEEEEEKPVDKKPIPDTKEKDDKNLPDGKGYVVPDDSDSGNVDIDNNVIIGGEDKGIMIDSDDESSMEEMEEETNQVDLKNAEMQMTKQNSNAVLAKPGILAGIIGGAVVGLLCMVLLVMFIVYRMRKKDEGSYPLDEQKYQNYSYNKAPDKEFYA